MIGAFKAEGGPKCVKCGRKTDSPPGEGFTCKRCNKFTCGACSGTSEGDTGTPKCPLCGSKAGLDFRSICY